MAKAIGFIGVGEMGFPIASNLVKAGHDLKVYDKLEEPLQELRKQGAQIAGSPKEAAHASDVVVIMVRTTEQALQVFYGEEGVLAGAQKGVTVIVTSTIAPPAVQEMAARAEEKGIALLDCPVSGARLRAEAGTLTIMAGGSREAFDNVKHILEIVGENIFYLGDSGMGEVAKLMNNLLLLVHMNAAYEALGLANKAGANIDVLLDLIKTSTGNSWIIENWEIVKSWKDNFKEGGTMDLIYKDIDMTLALAEKLKVPLLLSAVAKQLGRY